jgi:hypothetical protein
MDLAAIREGVAELLGALPGVRVYPYPPDQFDTSGSAAAVVIAPGEPYASYTDTFKRENALGQVNLIVSPYVQMVSDRAAWATLDELLSTGSASTRSLPEALLFADQTFVATFAEAIGVDDPTNVQALTLEGGARYLTCELPIRVYARRS